MPLTIAELETPVPVVDLDRLARNLDRAAAYATAHRLALRPHIKTHKSPRIASEQLRRGAVGVTCATPFEAEVMSEVCDDILVAYPPVGALRAARLANLPETAKLTVALDSMAAIDDLAQAARDAEPCDRRLRRARPRHASRGRAGRCRRHRAGARPYVSRPPLTFEGIAFYPGHVREPVDLQQPEARGAERCARLGPASVRARRHLHRAW